MSGDWARNVKGVLKEGKMDLKTDYKMHVVLESQCPDHCCEFALSGSVKQLQKPCNHDHSLLCGRCNNLKVAIADIEATLHSDNIIYR